MPPIGNIPADALADAVEKHVAKMDEAQLATLLREALSSMPSEVITALVASVFDAFRDRGESSEDAVEGANTALADVERGDRQAVAALIGYALENPGLLRESMALFALEHPAQIDALPQPFVDGVAARL